MMPTSSDRNPNAKTQNSSALNPQTPKRNTTATKIQSLKPKTHTSYRSQIRNQPLSSSLESDTQRNLEGTLAVALGQPLPPQIASNRH